MASKKENVNPPSKPGRNGGDSKADHPDQAVGRRGSRELAKIEDFDMEALDDSIAQSLAEIEDSEDAGGEDMPDLTPRSSRKVEKDDPAPKKTFIRKRGAEEEEPGGGYSVGEDDADDLIKSSLDALENIENIDGLYLGGEGEEAEEEEEEVSLNELESGPVRATRQSQENITVITEEELAQQASQVDDLLAEIASLKEESNRYLKNYARAREDFDSYRRRVNREKEDSRRRATEKLLQDILPVLDNFTRALGMEVESNASTSFREGVLLIYKLLQGALKQHGLEEISAIGQTFDPKLHEAMARIPRADVPANTVVEEYLKGYLLHDLLLRASLVGVSTPNGATGMAGPEGEEDPLDDVVNPASLDIESHDSLVLKNQIAALIKERPENGAGEPEPEEGDTPPAGEPEPSDNAASEAPPEEEA